jgi:ABC-type antimicrobial peptide transport system permease subunit
MSNDELMPQKETDLLERIASEKLSTTPQTLSERLDVGFISLKMALHGIGANKLRAFLTTLGVIIGVGAVIIAIGIGQGSKTAVADSLRQLGTNTLTIMPAERESGGIGHGTTNTLKMDDAEAILKQCTTIMKICPEVSTTAQVKYQNKNSNVSIDGEGADYPTINNHLAQSGRFFTEQENKSLRSYAVLGSSAATTLFGQTQPVGKSIRIQGKQFMVIGVLKSKGGMGFRNPDEDVYVPVKTAMERLLGITYIQRITCQARSEVVMNRAEDEIDHLMRKRHRLGANADNDFRIMNQADVTEALNSQQATFGSLITYLAIVSLMVGGIGIMNIMLVSVTERTREIGVRKAIGAKQHDILLQFMLEALLLSLVGGVLGLLFGIGGAMAVQIEKGWTIVIAPQTLILAFGFSAVVGVFFGLYPAYKASQLNPIEALRYE